MADANLKNNTDSKISNQNLSKTNKKNTNKNAKEDKVNKIVNIILSLSLIFIILAGFCIFVKFDVAGFGSGVLAPVMKNWPVVKNILPDTPKVDKEYPYNDMEEAVATIQKLQKKIDKLTKENDDINNEVNELKEENVKLKEFEAQQVEFEILKTEFEEDVVFGDDALDTSEYQKFYESIEPEHAQEMYKQIMMEKEVADEVQEFANTYAKMDPGQAADVLEELGDNLTLVCDILSLMSQKNRAAIMDEMSSEFAARVTQKIYSDNNF